MPRYSEMTLTHEELDLDQVRGIWQQGIFIRGDSPTTSTFIFSGDASLVRHRIDAILKNEPVNQNFEDMTKSELIAWARENVEPALNISIRNTKEEIIEQIVAQLSD